MTPEDLDFCFEYSPVRADETVIQHEAIRSEFQRFAAFLNENLPEGYSKEAALARVEEASYWGHSGIDRHCRVYVAGS